VSDAKANCELKVLMQVFISYGRLPNTILALDFGFTLPFNPHDQVEVWMGLSRRDPLRKSKLSLLHTHGMPTLLHTDGSDSGGNSFHIREVKSVIGRGKGIPHALRAFARVLCATSTHGEYSYNCWHWHALIF
jgi:histone-lysine N-methyltransferase SETD3